MASENTNNVLDSMTFPGTKNTQLTALGLPSWMYDMNLTDMNQVLPGMSAFQSIYNADPVPDEHIMEYLDGKWNETSTKPQLALIRSSPLQQQDDKTLTLPTHTGLVGTVLTAFNTHQNLQFRPDDLWISILAQFSVYVQGRAEELRDKIVDFQGKKELQVIAPGNIYSADFGSMTKEFLHVMSQEIKDPSLQQWFDPGFTTTTPTDQVVAAGMAMCSFSAYFSFSFGLICGIPHVTLLGSVEDWKHLREKVERLVEFDDAEQTMSKLWVPKLRTILDNFVLSAQLGADADNLDFWNQVVSHTGALCGGPDKITGWISTFSVFNQKGELYADMQDCWPKIGLDDIYHNIAHCPATIDDNGVAYNATLFVGQMLYDYTPDIQATETLPSSVASIDTPDGLMRQFQPRNDWALAISQGFQELPPREGGKSSNPDGTVLYGPEVCPAERADLLEEPFLECTANIQVPVFEEEEIAPTKKPQEQQGNNVFQQAQNSKDDKNIAAWLVPVIIIVMILLAVGLVCLKKRKRVSFPAKNKQAMVEDDDKDDKLELQKDDLVSIEEDTDSWSE